MSRLLLIAFCLVLAACASNPPSPDAFESAESAIEAARKAGAEELSPVELRFAGERLELARIAMDKKKYEEALMAIAQSEINSELAIEQSRAALERRKVNELTRSNEMLLEELRANFGEDFE